MPSHYGKDSNLKEREKMNGGQNPNRSLDPFKESSTKLYKKDKSKLKDLLKQKK